MCASASIILGKENGVKGRAGTEREEITTTKRGKREIRGLFGTVILQTEKKEREVPRLRSIPEDVLDSSKAFLRKRPVLPQHGRYHVYSIDAIGPSSIKKKGGGRRET